MGISSILGIARGAMAASQTAIQVTSHNVANVNTTGYTRQEAFLDEAAPTPSSVGVLGNGVVVERIVRYYDKYLEDVIAGKNGTLEEQKTAASYMDRLESIINEDNSKLSQNIVDFFNGWHELSTDPTSSTVRADIVAKGENLSRTIRNVYTELKNLQLEADNSIGQEVQDINRILRSVADLNTLIFDSATDQGAAGDYIDKRTLLVKELSGKMDVVSVEDEYGRLTLLSGKGKTLVDGDSYWTLDVMEDPETGFNRIAWEDHGGNLTDITSDITTGRLKGLMNVRDIYIGEGLLGDIDELAKAIVDEVNAIHEEGYTQNGTTGVAFFRGLTENYAKEISLSDAVLADRKNVAATSSSDNPTDNDIALRMAALGEQEVSIGGTQATFTDYVSGVIGNVGELAKNAKDVSEYQQSTMATIEKQRESISGVSLDEEMANLIKFQYSYQAAARLFTVADELFRSLLEAV
jgi:flagellar hook-associated protein 1 FlgK